MAKKKTSQTKNTVVSSNKKKQCYNVNDHLKQMELLKKKNSGQAFFEESEKLLSRLENIKAEKLTKMPRDLLNYHKNAIKDIVNDKYYIERLNENVYSISAELAEEEELQCVCLTSTYTRCKLKVKYIYKNLNREGEKIRYKKNLPFCQKHLKEVMKSSDKKTLRFGFYYESELYEDDIENFEPYDE